MRSYKDSIQYKSLSICASCGAEDRARTGSYYPRDVLPDLNVLRVRNQHIIDHTPRSRFTYIDASLDGLLLASEGVRSLDQECKQVEMYLCTSCFGSLTKNQMPRLALNNNLYRGELPDDLKDITWVEEMACALYRTTAHVARLFGTSNDTEPLLIRGNTCAHPMNVFANATALPWAPSDLNKLISVVFIGPRKLRPEDLQLSCRGLPREGC